MDNLTHTAVGFFLSRAGLNRWTPRATPIVILAANFPDVDVVSAAGGPLEYLNWHRYMTHSFLAAPVLALAAAALVRLISRRKVHWGGAFAAALVGVLSHLALDWTNIYGIRLLLPFSTRWLRADIFSVVDLWIWAVLLLAVAGPFLGRLVGSEIGEASRKAAHGRGWAIFALGFLLLYGAGRSALHERAVALLDSRIYGGEQPLRVAALPSSTNPLAWRGIVETRGAYSVHRIDLTRDFDPSEGAVFHKPEPEPAIDAARKSPVLRDFLAFSQYPLFRVLPEPEPEGARRVEAIDMRFGSPADPGFMAEVTVGPDLRVIGGAFGFGPFKPR